MGNAKHSSLDKAITEIATELAVRKFKLDGDKKKKLNNDQEELKLLLGEVQKNEEDVKRNIHAIYNIVVTENPGIVLQTGFNLDIANYMLQEVELHDYSSPMQIQPNSELANEILKYSIQYESNSREENVEDVATVLYFTQEGFSKFQENMKNGYGHNYFSENDLDNVKKENEEITNIIGKENINSLIERANNGDLEAARNLMIIQNAQIQIGYNSNLEKIPEDRLLDYLKDIILLAEQKDSIEISSILQKMAEKLPDEVFSINEDGTRSVNIDKLKEMYRSINNGKDIDIEFCRATYDDLARQYIENEECQFKNGAEDFTIENTIEGQQRMLQKNYAICVELQNNPEQRENLNYAIDELTRNSKKYLDASLRLAESMSQGRIEPSEKLIFEKLRDGVLEGLIEAREGTDFIDDEYTKQSKLNLFRSIINSSINNKENIDKELLEKISLADIDIAKEILRELIERQNQEPNVTLGSHIQMLGDAIREVSKVEEKGYSETVVTEHAEIKETQDPTAIREDNGEER